MYRWILFGRNTHINELARKVTVVESRLVRLSFRRCHVVYANYFSVTTSLQAASRDYACPLQRNVRPIRIVLFARVKRAAIVLLVDRLLRKPIETSSGIWNSRGQLATGISFVFFTSCKKRTVTYCSSYTSATNMLREVDDVSCSHLRRTPLFNLAAILELSSFLS